VGTDCVPSDLACHSWSLCWVPVAHPPPGLGSPPPSVADRARFDLALDAGSLLTSASRTSMGSPTTDPAGKPFPNGLGWFVRTGRGERLVWHTCRWEGAYAGSYLKIPARGVSLILLANSDGLQFPTPLDAATIETSPFAMAEDGQDDTTDQEGSMWSDEVRHAISRVHRRRIAVGLTLGAVAGAVAVAVAVGVLPVAAAAVMAAVVVGGAWWLLGSSPERTLGRRWHPLRSSGDLPANLVEEPKIPEPNEVRETRLGAFGRFLVTPRKLVIEALLATTAARIEDLAWVYGVRDPSRRWIPLLPDASLVLKFGNGAEITLPCFQPQVIPL